MNQKAKLDQLILRILKEEMDAMNTDSVKEQGNPDAKFFIYDNYAKKTIGKGFKTKEEAKKALDAVMEARPDLARNLSISDAGEVDENDIAVVTPDGTPNTATSSQKQASMHTKAGDTVKYKKPGQLEEYNEPVQDMEHDDAQPQGLDLAASLEEMMAHLKGIQEAPKDAKHANHAGKVMKHIGAAQEALKGLKGHNDMLEAKEAEQDQKDAGKHLANIKKHLGKVIKDKDTLERIMKKMPIEKAMELKKAKGGELDEEKVAKAMLKHVIKEGHFKSENSFKQDLTKLQNGIKHFGESLKKAGFNVDK
jgi:hypothetical protein